MICLGPRNRTPIGVDVGARCIKVAQFRRSADGWRVEAAVSMPRPHEGAGIDRAEAGRIRQAIRQGPFKGLAIVLAVPSEKLLTGIMELPPLESGAPIEMLARSELARMHKCDPQSFEMACWNLPSPARAANVSFVMGAACPHADADSLLDTFEAERLHVECLDIQSRAAARACQPLLMDVEGIAGILDLGWSAARLILLYKHVVVYERKLPKNGLASLVGPVAAELGTQADQVEHRLASGSLEMGSSAPAGADGTPGRAIDQFLDGIVEEMRIPVSYLANQYPDAAVERLLLTGGGARLPLLPAYLADALECDVRVVWPSTLATCPETFDKEFGSTLTVAFGLGLSEEGRP